MGGTILRDVISHPQRMNVSVATSGTVTGEGGSYREGRGSSPGIHPAVTGFGWELLCWGGGVSLEGTDVPFAFLPELTSHLSLSGTGQE